MPGCPDELTCEQYDMPVEYKQAILPSGLRICAEVDPAAHTAAVGFFVKTGARDETGPLMGVSHFLEHMMFKGTAKRTAEDVNRDFDNLGARSNAYTSSEMTAFHAAVLPDKLPVATEILADIMRPALRVADFTTEKGVILEEIAMYADEPVWQLYERLVEEHYGRESSLSHRVLGTAETIKAMEAEQMKAYFDNRYSADNTTVAMAGRIDFDAMVRHLTDLCGHWGRTGAVRTSVAPPPLNVEFVMKDPKVSRGYRMSMSRGPGMTDDARYVAFCAMQLLGGSDNSLLHWALVEPGLAENADAGHDPHDGSGSVRLFIAAEPAGLEKAWEIAMQQVRKLPELVTEQDLARIKSRVATGVVVAGERPDGRMHRLGRMFMYSDKYKTLEQELDQINTVTLEQVAAYLRAYPVMPATVGTMIPG